MGLFIVMSETRARRFTCRRCHHSQDAEVHGIGESVLEDSDEARRRARRAARLDLDRTIALARCPACKRRNPGAVLRFRGAYIMYVSAWFALGLALVLSPMWPDNTVLLRLFLLLVIGGTAALFPVVRRRRWANVDRRIRWVDEESSSGASQRLTRWDHAQRR